VFRFGNKTQRKSSEINIIFNARFLSHSVTVSLKTYRLCCLNQLPQLNAILFKTAVKLSAVIVGVW
jgi:hypothetical protein